MKTSLKKIEEEDLNALAKIMKESFLEKPWQEHWTIDSCLKRLSILFSMKTFLGYKLMLGEKVIGASFGYTLPYEEETQFHLVELFLNPIDTKQGYGTEFMNLLLEKWKENKIDRILLSTRGSLSLFYARFGFSFSSDTIMEKKI